MRVLEPEEHDRALALTSHLPHLLAAALAGILPPELYDLTATGFRDTTRVAVGDPALWTAIFLQNQAALLEALTPFRERLQRLVRALETENRGDLITLLDQAKKVRDALGS
ncbi:MAG: prephenate dehydrogenase [Planctomycetes bacterium]|nr:prephenate dehydrogenase [Planctomycetota bacterium]